MARAPFPVPVCDPHFHVWDNSAARNENLGDIARGPLGVYTGAAFAAEAAAGGLALCAAVHVETVVGQAPGGFALDTLAETRFVVAQAAALPCPVGVVAYAHLARPDAAWVVAAHAVAARGSLRGVRQIMNWSADGALTWPQVEHGDYFDGASAASRALAAALAGLAAADLAFDLHVNWFQAAPAAAFLAAHAPPGLRVVVDHVACPKLGAGAAEDEARLAEWRAGVSALAARPATHMKLSGLEYAAPGWLARASPARATARALVAHCLAAFGPGRCMFASNFPVDKAGAPGSDLGALYAAFWELCDELDVPSIDRVGLFAGNARAAYKI